MHNKWLAFVALALTTFAGQSQAMVILDYDELYVDGVYSASGLSGAGLGTVSVSVSGAGSHTVGLFVDHEIDQNSNTFFNEYGATSGSPAAGQSWEIDEPGFVYGDIYSNFPYLDNSNGVPNTAPDDVSMAMAWDFVLAADETGTVNFYLSTSSCGGSGICLMQADTEGGSTIYFSSALRIVPGGGQVPVPGTLALLGIGLMGVAVAGRRHQSKG